MLNESLFSSERMDWETPKNLYDKLDDEFNFTLDPCASAENHKTKKFFDKNDDGLSKDWSGETVFCNPPYGRGIALWVEKCYKESLKPHTLVVLLIPARTDTIYFHNWILGKSEIRFIKSRLKFELHGQSFAPAPFPSMVVVMGNNSISVGKQ